MAAMYETLWHAVVVGPILLLIAIVEFFLTIGHFRAGRVDRSSESPWETYYSTHLSSPHASEAVDDALHSR